MVGLCFLVRSLKYRYDNESCLVSSVACKRRLDYRISLCLRPYFNKFSGVSVVWAPGLTSLSDRRILCASQMMYIICKRNSPLVLLMVVYVCLCLIPYPREITVTGLEP